jgi:predicted MFS family arabinose efflux permease
LGVPMMLLALLGQSIPLALPLLMLWGVAFGMLPIAVQSWMFAAAPRHLEAVQALFVSLSQVAIGCGALVGGFLVDRSGVTSALWVAAITLVLTAAGFAVSTRRAVMSMVEAPVPL